ncbi:MAG: excinuclease subunit, partial [Chthoniobacter sp.]|nr:excinuclease subunit [Chthoniobacter sp.]
MPDMGFVEIRGVRQNNLKGIDLDLPLGKLNVISGPSGSGKSSLAFDTIYAEGQRRYVETFSPYTRQFLERMDKPKVDAIHGIPPAIAIEQSNNVKSTRSTVGTMTEINDYLKVLMPRVARAFCPECSREIRCETARSIADEVFATFAGKSPRSASKLKNSKKTRRDPSAAQSSARDDAGSASATNVLITFGVPVPPKTAPADFYDFLKQQGYLRVWIEGEIHRTDAAPAVERLPALVRVVQDRIAISEENRSRVVDAIETALRFGKGRIAIIPADKKSTTIHPFSTGWHCAHCDLEITAPTPGLFSFNNPLGACPKCRGFGRTITIDVERALDRTRSIARGAVKVFQTENGRECQRDLLKHCAEQEIDVQCPFADLPAADQKFVICGEQTSAGATSQELWENGRWYGIQGFFDWLETKSYKMHVRVLLSRYRTYATCPDCNGGRFQPAALNFKITSCDGSLMTLPNLAAMPVARLAGEIANCKSHFAKDATTEMLRQEVETRLRYLVEVGLGYLALDRATRSLSGGEVERVNLTTCLGASLVNALFVMDEPSVGLHPRDITQLIRVMKNLRDKGN